MTVKQLALALDEILRTSQLNLPDQLPCLVAKSGAHLGAVETALYLIDYEQGLLVPLQCGGLTRVPIELEGTTAGRAFREVALQEEAAGTFRRLWVPLSDGVERLGICGIPYPFGGKSTRCDNAAIVYPVGAFGGRARC